MLKALQKEDKGQFFRVPVDPQHVPDYYCVIQHPTDLQTLQQSIACAHPSENEFIANVTRMFSNAKLYNDQNHPVYKEAVRLQHVFYTYLDSEMDEDVADAVSALYCISTDH